MLAMRAVAAEQRVAGGQVITLAGEGAHEKIFVIAQDRRQLGKNGQGPDPDSAQPVGCRGLYYLRYIRRNAGLKVKGAYIAYKIWGQSRNISCRRLALNSIDKLPDNREFMAGTGRCRRNTDGTLLEQYCRKVNSPV